MTYYLVKLPIGIHIMFAVKYKIFARIERERSIMEGNRELIRIYEEKVKKVIERVWES